MLSIEKICKSCSTSISKELKLDKNKEAVINYGIFAIIHMSISIILVAIFGAIFGVLKEALIVSFIGSILRKSSGGAHAGSPGKCALIGTIVSVGIGAICNKSNISVRTIMIMGIITFSISYYFIYKLAPVDSPAKVIKNINKKLRLKKASILILTVYLIIVIINVILYYFYKSQALLGYSMCIYLSILWQVFSLTKSGHYLLGKIDTLF